jgi:hypothetical protein
MIIGMSTAAFTLLHVIISLVGTLSSTDRHAGHTSSRPIDSPFAIE